MTSQQIIGRYEVLEELGQGAMGTVYRAKDPAMDRVVALKTIRSEILSGQQGGEFRERFYREARAAGALAHPGIVPVFDVGEHDGMPFLVMEFIKGRTLADAARSGERLPLERVCEIGQQIAEALGYAHQKGVVHRDIKAANILLTSRDSYGIERPKITDFGVAKLASVQITTTGQMLGTPAFMPPEQFSGGPIDGRTDLFSLGVILYWMCTGEYPFPGENLMTISYKVMHTEPVPPRKLNPAVSESLDGVILKCLAKNPAERYQTGEELARDLSAVRAGRLGIAARSGIAVTAAAGATAADPQATLDPSSTAGASTAGASRPPLDAEPPIARPPMATPVGTKKENLVLMLVLLALVIALGGLYVLQNRDGGNLSAPAAATTGTAAASAPAPAVKTPAPTQPVAAAAAAVNFNPLTLNPNENARLRVDIQRVPPNVELALVMDGKLYIRRSAVEFEKNDDDMYLPPGIHEFRVRARTGRLLKVSNIVSTDFEAKKRKTLRIELRLPPQMRGTSPTPQQLATAAQVFVSLR
jgi:serine/threonine-protein kinase